MKPKPNDLIYWRRHHTPGWTLSRIQEIYGVFLHLGEPLFWTNYPTIVALDEIEWYKQPEKQT